MKTSQAFVGADMRCSHQGLISIAEKYGAKLSALKPGEAFLFINSSKDRIKSLSWNGVLSYVNFQGTGRKLDLDAISEIPKAMGADGVMNYGKALRATLEKKLGSKRFSELERLK